MKVLYPTLDLGGPNFDGNVHPNNPFFRCASAYSNLKPDYGEYHTAR